MKPGDKITYWYNGSFVVHGVVSNVWLQMFEIEWLQMFEFEIECTLPSSFQSLVLGQAYEGFRWIYGHHAFNSPEVLAMRAATALTPVLTWA